MEIIAHRGFWNYLDEKNTSEAFKKAFNSGFGIETDIRDYNSRLVISHNVATENSVKLEDLCLEYKKNQNEPTLALNIKADGLQDLLKVITNKFFIKNYFVFDMSIPDTIRYLELDMNVYMRQSEFEKEVPFYEQSKGIWLDSFNNVWYTIDLIEYHFRNSKKVCIVSPELHNREYLKLWQELKKNKLYLSNDLILCTDFPEKAKVFYYE